MNRYVIIVVPADKMGLANLDADRVDTAKTSRTFTVGLSPTGKEPATSHWCCWWVMDKELEELKKDFDPVMSGNKYNSYMFDPAVTSPETILKLLGLQRIQPTILGVSPTQTEVAIEPPVIEKPSLVTRATNFVKSLLGIGQ